MKILKEYLQKIGKNEKIAADAVEKFCVYRDFLIEQNNLFNLTAITDPIEIETKHFIDSLSAYEYISGSVADIGTGAGFPGLALKLIFPDNEFTLIDSLNKRISFLNGLIEKLGLEKVNTIHSRAEDLPKDKKYDTVVARAVSRLNTLSEYCLPFVKKGGLFIAYKSEECDEEISEAANAIKILGGKIRETVKVPLFGTDIVRSLVIIEKINDTPLKYPRNQNKPKKQPLM